MNGHDECPLCERTTDRRVEGWLVLGLILVSMLALGLSHGCATLQDVWKPIEGVLTQCIAPAPAELKQDVSRILQRDGAATELSEAAKADLGSLAKAWGAEVIACVIAELLDTWLAPGRASIPQAEANAARRAQLFLSQHDARPVVQE